MINAKNDNQNISINLHIKLLTYIRCNSIKQIEDGSVHMAQKRSPLESIRNTFEGASSFTEKSTVRAGCR